MFFLTTVCVKLLGLYLPFYMFCGMRASVSGLMALLVLWFFSIKYIHSFAIESRPSNAIQYIYKRSTTDR